MSNNNDKYKNYSREELIDELETLKKKKYGLIWDKKNSQEMLDVFVNWENVPENFTPKQFPILKEVKNKEIETDKNKPTNLLIEGDNYHSLAVLNFTHQNKIDVIYIDPPYNTGNKDFIYNDKFIDKEDPFRHSKWLSFMEKRLRLAHRLLKNTGVIFISIDDHEQAQLRLLCDEIFSEENFVNNIIWKKTNSPKFQSANLGNQYEFVLVYAKDFSRLKLNRIYKPFDEKSLKPYSYEDSRGKFRLIELEAKGLQNNQNRKKAKFKDRIAPWVYSIETLEKWDKEGLIYKTNKGRYAKKQYLDDMEGVIIADIWIDSGINPLQGSSEEYIGFETQKPLSLIKRILKLGSLKDNSIILDFFAGSGTTGQAILELNKEDNGNRKFILCTNDEELDNNGNIKKHKICTDVCYPRIEKVIGGYKNSKGEKVAGLGGNLKYFKTDFVGSDSTDKNKRDLVNKSTEMICIKENIFDLVADGGLDYRIYQKGKKFLGVIFELDAVADFKKEAEKHKGNFVVYCFSYTETTPEKEFKGLKNKYVLKPIPAVILRIYLEIFKK
ncbi:MAG: site-specific DNA-methyltransferase [Candidatus Pacebacteria bacterium]|nr:site-specific DNA-methyltransferase [Massilibacteroides sp.]MDD3940564.1 site-specific DNA-methyltransferase [Candidatus Paceibacterota bacterium]